MTAIATAPSTSFHRNGRPAGALVRSQSYAVHAHRPGRAGRTAQVNVTQVNVTKVYVRRRVLVAAIALAIVLLVGLGAGNVVANRGTAPASGSSVRPAIATYVVHHGDTMWSIATARHGALSVSDYVDLLVQANGGAQLQVGQQITLP